ncbi:MAG: NUDIX hydrolase [Anaerolineae bacterium]|nr:MAG: NUDIX hydrolase [Anaerolineae bacterium]
MFTYCPHCATRLQWWHDGERKRQRCPACGWIHYRNPTVGVAVILLQEGRILLGQRRSGKWCIPCGHVEWDESIEQAALREFEEETGLRVTLRGVFAVHSNFHNPRQHTVGVWYRGERLSGHLRPGGDVQQVAFYPLDAPPPLAFPTDALVLEKLRLTS